jgi:putative hydroxymethylpyrimidine transport system ATP-binding protein
MISIQDASLQYGSHCIYRHLNLHIPAKQWVAILGPSGIGKSSLLKSLANLKVDKQISSASITVSNGLPLASQIAYMAQSDALLPWYNVWHNAILSYKLNPKAYHFDHFQQQARLLLTAVGLDHALTLYPKQLSGGMRQRVALVRTLLTEKSIILMDEPFSALDAITRLKLQQLTCRLLQDKTVIFITHDPQEAVRLADQVYLMQGQPAQLEKIASISQAKPRDCYQQPLLSIEKAIYQRLSA